ncbi:MULTISPECIES: M15 family metallopeptidase [unclassified Pedobacter]|uniref:M15 family metallopeptidase n=1 Tax=unclassified Pedobacter TaxID=2628915 RepID=UPI0014236DB6|nr:MULTISPECIES: M15 family metallopeptidase [unclassified Pedobacter]NII84442.1 D-alanyl-D-alanine dipeptidase [Pedobacter sp. SG908]NMN38643.1 D-alanyl-D-alanine dipeptidase [Pedobacter sp. SG918]
MKFNLLIFFLIISLSGFSQNKPSTIKKLVVVGSYNQYLASVKTDPNNELVEIKKAIPNIKLDIRYATNNNFMQQVMYKQARAFARKPVVESLKKIQKELNKKGYGLKIFDGYRPYAVTVEFYKKASDKNFVANPSKGSKHNRGCAVDLTLIDLKTGKEITMPTPYDSFLAAAAAKYKNVSPEAKKNRDFLIAIMGKYQMNVLENEWWHYDFSGWKKYDLMDIPFEKL